MIKKQVTLNNGVIYLVGFKEIGSIKDGIECHLLEESILGDKSYYSSMNLKGIAPDYKKIALDTIIEYELDKERKEKLISEQW